MTQISLAQFSGATLDGWTWTKVKESEFSSISHKLIATGKGSQNYIARLVLSAKPISIGLPLPICDSTIQNNML